MPQLADACTPATLNKEIPNKAIAGATVIGVMYFSIIPTIPEEEKKSKCYNLSFIKENASRIRWLN